MAAAAVVLCGKPAFGSGGLPFPGQPAYGEPPALAAGTPMTVPVEVSVPATADPVTLTLNGQKYPLERVRDYYYQYAGVPVTSGQANMFCLTAGAKATSEMQKALYANVPLRAGLPWTDSPVLQKPGFIKGHTLMDAGGTSLPRQRPARSGARTMP